MVRKLKDLERTNKLLLSGSTLAYGFGGADFVREGAVGRGQDVDEGPRAAHRHNRIPLGQELPEIGKLLI